MTKNIPKDEIKKPGLFGGGKLTSKESKCLMEKLGTEDAEKLAIHMKSFTEGVMKAVFPTLPRNFQALEDISKSFSNLSPIDNFQPQHLNKNHYILPIKSVTELTGDKLSVRLENIERAIVESAKRQALRSGCQSYITWFLMVVTIYIIIIQLSF